MRKISKCVIHCTATPEGREHNVADIRRWHLKRGFSDIGYHYLIHIDGTVEEGCEPNSEANYRAKEGQQRPGQVRGIGGREGKGRGQGGGSGKGGGWGQGKKMV